MQDFILPAIQHRDGRLLGRDRAFLDEDSLETVYAQRWYAERQAGTPEAEIDAAIRAKEDLTPVPLDKRRVPSSASDGYDPEFRAYMEREVWPFVMQCGGLLEYKGERFVSVNQLQADLNSRCLNKIIDDRRNQEAQESEAVLNVLGTPSSPSERNINGVVYATAEAALTAALEAEQPGAIITCLHCFKKFPIAQPGGSSLTCPHCTYRLDEKTASRLLKSMKERLAKREKPVSLVLPNKWRRDKSGKSYTYAGVTYDTAVEALTAGWKAETPDAIRDCEKCTKKFPLAQPGGFSLMCPHCGYVIGEDIARGALKYFQERLAERQKEQAAQEEAAAVAKLREYADEQPDQGQANGGYVYILINSAMPGVVKVGKTEREPEDRAKELSGVTGIPTPYSVAYDEWFADCSRAEEYIHTLLTANGYRVADNREFFSVPVKVAIKAVVEAKAREEKAGGQGTDKGNV
jgi:DNA-directed RNA polymerase subunit RPC12/RpoP